MDILQKLADLGFTNASVFGEGLTRVRTSRGWVYERFKTEEQIIAWARNREPEEQP